MRTIKRLEFKRVSGPPKDPVYEAVVGDHRYQIANVSDEDKPLDYRIFLSFTDSEYEGEIQIGRSIRFDFLDVAKEYAQNDFDQRINKYFV